MLDKKDIKELDDIKLLVNSFYEKVRVDNLLGGIFNGVIKDKWPVHLEKMYRFWQTVLLEDHTYHGSPFKPHGQLPVQKQHFDRWKKLFNETVDMHFQGEKADEAKSRAEKMAAMFLAKITYYQSSGTTPLV